MGTIVPQLVAQAVSPASGLNGRPAARKGHATLSLVEFVRGLRCVECGKAFSTRVQYTCPDCGIGGILDVEYDYPAIARRLTRRELSKRVDLGQWRYRELLPIRADAALPALSVGGTPVTAAPRLAKHLGIATLFLKDDGRNPSGSLKDRASAIGVVKAREKRHGIVACASTGNAASSCAGMAASLGLGSVIFVPQYAPEPKVTQLLIFGATVLRVAGSYEQAFQLCQRACERWGWYNRNCAINPYLVEGKKTAGLEACEQLGWDPPEWVAVSVGDGCTVAGIWKGFREMKALGLAARTPKMLGVQAAGAAPVTAAFHSGGKLEPVEPHTVADSIGVGVPRNWKKAIAAIRESGGEMIDVSDAEILDAMRYTGRLAGIFAEPAAAASVAGLRRAVEQGMIGRRSGALAMITGNGLKDIRSAHGAAGEPFDIPPEGGELDEILKERGLIS
jgi:threonine synthase